MSNSLPFATIHSSALRQPALPDWVPATRRPGGALRYRCPATGSVVLLTEPAALARLAAPQTAVRCLGCGDTHLLGIEDEAAEIVRPRTAA